MPSPLELNSIQLEPDYFAVIKLSNNESIIGGVLIDEDETGIHVFDPLSIKQISVVSDGLVTQQYMLSPWMIHSSDTVFFINSSHIITNGEMSSTMFDQYTSYINSDLYNDFYSDVGTDVEDFDLLEMPLDDAKRNLEKLYKQNDNK